MSRFVVGIDLGTTNCALAYADLTGKSDQVGRASVVSLPIPQLIDLGEVGERPTLPSFLYLPGEGEFESQATRLPWSADSSTLVGHFAREHGGKVPARLIHSAKSWLCQADVDGQSAILPWMAPQEVGKRSPVEVSTIYLKHLCNAWFQAHPDAPLGDQEVFLTVPASFDARAREQTMQAANAAGLEQVTLLEEPQAAFYAWLASQDESWRDQLAVGDLVLVCDLGGGTTDFSLIRVEQSEGDLVLNRLAVGDHILLGGDNMDLALAYTVANQLDGGMEGLDPNQRLAILHACRDAKEKLFTDEKLKDVPIRILGRGSRLIGGTKKIPLSRDLLGSVVLDGFFPLTSIDELPEHGPQVGLVEIGLPYAADAAVTKHLAEFLQRQAKSLDQSGAEVTRPTAILFNGGVFRAPTLRNRVTDVLRQWGSAETKVLPGHDLDLAVARGAAYYGLVRQGKGIRIRGGTGRAYYIGVQTAMPAVPGMAPPLKAICVVPMGQEEGTGQEIPGTELNLVTGRRATFRFFSSTTRRDDQPGQTLTRWAPEELEESARLETTLEAPKQDEKSSTSTSKPVETVRLQNYVSEVGTLQLYCQSIQNPNQRWQLEFETRETK